MQASCHERLTSNERQGWIDVAAAAKTKRSKKARLGDVGNIGRGPVEIAVDLNIMATHPR